MAEMATRKKGGLIGRIGTLLLLVATFAILVSLGTWQMQRLHWKEGLIARADAAAVAPPTASAPRCAAPSTPATGRASTRNATGPPSSAS